MGPTPWHKTLPTRGGFSGLTSDDFYQRYADAYDGTEVTYHGAANFAAACALADAVERAGSLSASAVAAALETSTLQEFYGTVAFDQNRQIALPMLIAQVAEGKGEEDIVFPPAQVTSGVLQFPMPTWRQRRCGAVGPSRANNYSAGLLLTSGGGSGGNGNRLALICSGNGRCTEEGTCECSAGYSGSTCNLKSDVQCGPGLTASAAADGSCVECPLGTYKKFTSNDPCIACPIDATTLRTGAVDSGECVCRAGFFRTDSSTPASNCEICPALADCGVDTVVETLRMRAGTWRLSNKTTQIVSATRPRRHSRTPCQTLGLRLETGLPAPLLPPVAQI